MGRTGLNPSSVTHYVKYGNNQVSFLFCLRLKDQRETVFKGSFHTVLLVKDPWYLTGWRTGKIPGVVRTTGTVIRPSTG
jgi:hypothetical protein